VTQVLAALVPAALELSLAAATEIQQERERLHRNWQQPIERARYQAERARRQYDTVEPENRLVGRELERRWEDALQEQQRLEEDDARFGRTQPATLSATECAPIRSLAADLPVLWRAPTPTAADRQRIVRLVVEEVRVRVRGESACVEVTIRWAGGQSSQQALTRPVQRYEQLAHHPELRKRIDELREAGQTLTQIAEHLQQEGFHPPKRCRRFRKGILSALLRKRERSGPRPARLANQDLLREQAWFLPGPEAGDARADLAPLDPCRLGSRTEITHGRRSLGDWGGCRGIGADDALTNQSAGLVRGTDLRTVDEAESLRQRLTR
jgi:hypothetical protein